jgi:NADPH:quinone reductase-like Zn-dependent oxidoreductase
VKAPNGNGPAEGTRVAALVPARGWAELVAVPAANTAVVPDDVTLEAAATLPTAALTVIRAFDVAGSLLGKTILVTGGSGGVGQFAIQLGRLAGATVVAVSSRREQWAHLRQLGAKELVPVIDETNDRFDFVLESAGGGSLAAAIARVARGGGIVTIGNSSEEETTFNARTLYAKGGAWIYGLLIFDEIERRRVGGHDLERVLALLQRGELTAPIELRRSWTDLPSVLDGFERRTFAGKAVVTVT